MKQPRSQPPENNTLTKKGGSPRNRDETEEVPMWGEYSLRGGRGNVSRRR